MVAQLSQCSLLKEGETNFIGQYRNVPAVYGFWIYLWRFYHLFYYIVVESTARNTRLLAVLAELT